MAHAAEVRTESVFLERARRLAPWLVVMAMAYPLLIWPLLEAPAPVANPDFAPAAPDVAGGLNRILFPPLMLAGVAVFLLQARAGRIDPFRPVILLTGLYVLWAAASMAWALEPGVVARRSALQVTIVGSVLLPTVAARDPARVFNRLFWLFALAAAVNLYAVIRYPPGLFGHAGIYTHKNTLGGVAAIIFLFALFQSFASRGLVRLVAIGVTLAAVALMAESQSKSALGLSVLAPALAFVVCLVARGARITPALSAPLGLGALYLGYVIGLQSYLWDFEAMATAIFGDPTLTQRTDIWDFALKMIERRPWLGFGYEAFWGVSFESPSMREAPGFIAKMPHAHNGYLDLIIHTGVVGFAIFLALLLALLHAAGRMAWHSIVFGTALLALILSCMFYNFTETTWFRSFDLQHLVFLVAVGLAASAQDLIERRGR